MTDLLSSLNPEQRTAAETIAGPLLVLAGAGTGKTRVITARIAHMLSRGIDPRRVLAMTFTNKAAAEMRERVAGTVGKTKAKALTVGTFHAWCARALRAHGRAVGLPRRFAICDAADQLAALKGALRELCIPEARIHPRALGAAISLAKNRLETPAEWLEGAADERDELIGRAWVRYQEHLERRQSVDFDDLLLLTLRLLREDAGARAKLRERAAWVLVDEYQDTNRPQFEILRLLCDEHRNLCAVGDDDQSIYGWRGADLSLILDFERHFPEARVVRLGTNYRCTPQILAMAQRLIRNNPRRHDKDLRAALPDGPVVAAMGLEDEAVEAEWTVERIARDVRQRRAAWRDFAVLFRTGVQSRPYEQTLRARGIPYVLVGGPSFFDRKEVRDVLAYAKLLQTPQDEVSLLRVVNVPPRGVGKTTLERVLGFATEHGISACEAFDRSAEIGGVPGAAVEAVARLRARLAALARDLRGAELVEGLKRLVDQVGYRGEVERLYPDPRERQLRWAGVLEVFSMAENYVRRERRPSLAGFLEGVALQQRDDAGETDQARDAVTLMTLHSAKGLEFPRVFLAGFEERLLPHERAVAEDTIEEERRLVYVGITRAQRELTITWAATRARAGQRAPTFPSRFYYELRQESPPADWIAAGAPSGSARAAPRRGRGASGRAARAGKRSAGGRARR